jgi:hypothetical protein
VGVPAHLITSQHALNKEDILSFGVNDEKVHSEVCAVSKLRKLPDRLKNPKKIDIVVLRVSPTGKLGMSKPCKHCIIGLSIIPLRLGYKIDDVYYSNDGGTITKTTMTRLLQEDNPHVSRGNRH